MVVRVDVDIQDKEGQKEYFDALIDLFKDPKKQEEYRDLAWAQSYFSWANIAKQWDGLLRGTDSVNQIMMTPQEWQKYLNEQKQQIHV
jgi:hypothetical protein